MKKLLFILTILVCCFSASADTYFSIDDFEVPVSSLGKRFIVPVKAHFPARLNAWQLYFTLPDGLSLRQSSKTDQMKIYFYDWEGLLDSITPGVQVGSIPTVLSCVMAEGYWDPDGDGTYETYGSVKWEAGDYDRFFLLTFNVDANFKGGEITIETIASSGKDTRGGTLKEIGEDGKQFFTTTMVTVQAAIPGDVNSDGQISIADATMLIDYLLSGDESSLNLDAADHTGDGEVTINDVTSIIDSLLTN